MSQTSLLKSQLADLTIRYVKLEESQIEAEALNDTVKRNEVELERELLYYKMIELVEQIDSLEKN